MTFRLTAAFSALPALLAVMHNGEESRMPLTSARSAFFPAAVAAPHASEISSIQAEVMALYDELRDRLLRYAMSFGLSIHDGEDVLQEVFLALFRHLSADRSRENLHGWAFRTTHNLALKRRAAQQVEQRRVTVPEDSDPSTECCDEAPGPEESLLFRERQRRLRSVLQALPTNDRSCLQLRAEGLRYREIASTLGVSLGSVAASLARSFEKLQRMDAR